MESYNFISNLSYRMNDFNDDLLLSVIHVDGPHIQ